MKAIDSTLRCTRRLLGAGLLAGIGWSAALAHGGAAGDVAIEHPYATPTPAGAVNGAAFLTAMQNNGKTPDRLLKASTPVADHTELHTMTLDAGGVMRMREIAEVALAPGERVTMQPAWACTSC